MERFIFNDKRIAIIDDDDGIISSYQKILERRGFWVITFTNPIEALEWFENNDVDVILLDYYMPQKTGGQFAEEYKGNAVIILQTGYSDELPPDEMIDKLNIQNYFDKTRDVEELILCVKSAIKTASLYKQVNMLNYEKEFMSNLLVSVTDETKSQVMALAGQKYIIEDEATKLGNDRLKHTANSIGVLLEKMNHTFKALNFTGKEINLSNLSKIFDVVKTLTLAKSSVIFKLEQGDDEYIRVKCKGSVLVYIISEIAMYLYSNNVECTEIIGKIINGNVSILINKSFDYSNEIISKIINIAMPEKNIDIAVNSDNLLEITIA